MLRYYSVLSLRKRAAVYGEGLFVSRDLKDPEIPAGGMIEAQPFFF
jgi:hypothetical protein